MTSLNPAFTIGNQLVEAIRLHAKMKQARGARTRGRAARPRRHPRPRAPARGLPAPAVGRHAPARPDRDGARRASRACSSPTSPRPRSTSPCRRRSSTCCDRSRRELGMAVIFVTHDLGVIADICRPGRGDVRGPGGGGGIGPRPVRASPAPVHRRVARGDPPGRRARRAVGVDPRRRAGSPRDADRLPVPPALPVRDARVHASRAGRAPCGAGRANTAPRCIRVDEASIAEGREAAPRSSKARAS